MQRRGGLNTLRQRRLHRIAIHARLFPCDPARQSIRRQSQQVQTSGCSCCMATLRATHLHRALIGIEKLDELSARQLEATVAGYHRPMRLDHATNAIGERLDDTATAVRRSVVDDDDLRLRVGLGERTADRISTRRFRVETRNDDADRWSMTACDTQLAFCRVRWNGPRAGERSCETRGPRDHPSGSRGTYPLAQRRPQEGTTSGTPLAVGVTGQRARCPIARYRASVNTPVG